MNKNKFVYHITSSAEWNAAQPQQEYKAQDFDKEGFIHCSYCHQILTVAHRFFKGQSGLVILVIESSKINNSLVEENLEGGVELYPHLYSVLPTKAVSNAIAFPCDTDGNFTLPDELKV